MKYLFIFCLAILTGCTQKPEIQVVKVPVYSCPMVDIPKKPKLDLEKITNDSSDVIVLKSYGRSIDQLINFQNNLLDILKKQNELSEHSKLHQNDK